MTTIQKFTFNNALINTMNPHKINASSSKSTIAITAGKDQTKHKLNLLAKI